ncbi:hypothetical protein CPLU01_04432 [Colletotrichum plurivorum]|uniref:DUF6546 domain-containing protein n=1 Tax=Colletotrichum plurivorum TaxID=2175906 RepID=A0A8H6NIY9_9PEZI|nr:hypothetical protein CPLU01_04432 [Colletotrichum plurivorum]
MNRRPEWRSLPKEIRHLILELLPSTGRGWSAHAQVCQEWQGVLERENFRQLDLRALCLDNMDRFVTPRVRPLIKHIWLDLEVRQHACVRCPVPEGRFGSYTTAENNTSVAMMIKRLFSILSQWTPEDAPNGLTLELSVTSPTDNQHYFRNLYFGCGSHTDDTPDPHRRRKPNPHTHLRPQIPQDWYHDPKHDWVDGRQVSPPRLQELNQLFRAVSPRFEDGLPTVHAINELVIRRQTRRQFEPWSLGRIMKDLPRLERLVYEPWRGSRNRFSLIADTQYIMLLLDCDFFPSTTKKISLFEDYNPEYTGDITETRANNSRSISAPALPLPTCSLAQAFVQRSRRLEQLSVAFMIEAGDFFQAWESKWIWENLTKLALTSSKLDSNSKPTHVAALLRSAATAALSMPKLQNMVIWNGKRDEACKFQYSIEKSSENGRPAATITWKGTWNFILDPEGDVVRDWDAVAAKTDCEHLHIQTEPRITAVVNSHAHAIRLLGLPTEVIDPSSLWQIEKEMETSWRKQQETGSEDP